MVGFNAYLNTINRNRPTAFTEQTLNRLALANIRDLVLFSNWSRRVFLAGYGKEIEPLTSEVTSTVLETTKKTYKAFTLMDNVYDCPDSWFWFENAAAYLPYIAQKEIGVDSHSSFGVNQSIFLGQVRSEMLNPNSKFAPSFLGWVSTTSKTDVCFEGVTLRQALARIGYMKIKMNFIFPLRLKRRKVAQTASYGVFKKQWRQLSRSKQLAQRAKVPDLTAWARAANNLDVSWLAKKVARTFNRTPVIFWWRKKPRRHMYWKLVKKRKPQKKFKTIRGVRRLISTRRRGRPMILPRSGLFSICQPFNGRWARTPARWPFKKRRVIVNPLVKKVKTRGVLLRVQSTYLQWLSFFGQEYFWFGRQLHQPTNFNAKLAMQSFVKWAETRDVMPAGMSLAVTNSQPTDYPAGSAGTGRFQKLGLRRKILWNYAKVTSAYWAGIRSLTAAPLGSVAVVTTSQV